MTTAYAFVQAPQHKYPDHPERPGRLAKLIPKLDSFQAEKLEAVPAKHEDIARVHLPGFIMELEQICREQAPSVIDFAPTYVTQTSFEDAMLAAGATLACARAVISGKADNAFAIVRPPGHHSEPDKAMGFCLFNNVAIAARDALAKGLERVLVIDYDAHHGNGTQAAFLEDERCAYLSTHQAGIYPGTGNLTDAPNAKKRIVNVPLPTRTGNDSFGKIIDEIVQPTVEAFKPEMIFVSAGFDAHWSDPLTALGLSSSGFYNISKRLVHLAEEHCRGKIVFVLEGGYDPTNVANGCEAVFLALTRTGDSFDAGDPSPHAEPEIEPRLEEVLKWHGF
ncbi:MAG: histone deacetylase [Anaerolineae bacterium]|nr:histone deacetylase [Anaerolineae bacterium]